MSDVHRVLDNPPLTLNAWLRHDPIFDCLESIPSGARLLEIGTGQGAMSVRLARRFEYTGVEADEVSAGKASARLRGAGLPHTLHVGAFESAPLDAPYDIVCAFEVLEHIEDDEAALATWSKLLAPGGRLVISVPAWNHRMGLWDQRVGHYRRYDPDVLGDLFRRVGFSSPDIRLYGFPLGYLLEHGRNLMARRGPSSDIGDPNSDMEELTAASGRLYQPTSRVAATITDVATRPFRLLQRRGRNKRLGTGIVACVQRPT